MSSELISSLIIGITSYTAGLLSGYFLRGTIKEKVLLAENGNTLVLTVVTLIWAASMLVDIISPEYTTSPLVHGLMGAIVGFFYKPLGKK